MDLTKRQKEIFDFIGKYAAKYRIPAHRARDRQGRRPALLLDRARPPREPREDRAAAPRPDQAAGDRGPGGQGQEGDEPAGLPLVGQVAAGEPILAEENIEDYLEVPDVIGGENGDYILRVKGDSMIGAGILEDDFVVVRPAQVADDGEIVVAMIDGEATVKSFYRRRTTSGSSPRTRPTSRSAPRTRGARPGRRGLQEGLTMSATATRRRRPRERAPTAALGARLFEPRAGSPSLEERSSGSGRSSPARLGRVPRLRRADRSGRSRARPAASDLS